MLAFPVCVWLEVAYASNQHFSHILLYITLHQLTSDNPQQGTHTNTVHQHVYNMHTMT